MKEETQNFYIEKSSGQLPTKQIFRGARGLAPFEKNNYFDVFGKDFSVSRHESSFKVMCWDKATCWDYVAGVPKYMNRDPPCKNQIMYVTPFNLEDLNPCKA